MPVIFMHQRDTYARAVVLAINKYLAWTEKYVRNVTHL